MFKFMSALLMTGFLVSCCSNTPNVIFSYHPVKWKADVIVTQTVGCNSTGTRLLVANTPSVTTSYSSNFDKICKINIKDLDGTFADVDIALAFTEDGRLKSINHSTTGQGELIVKSAVSLATALMALPKAPKMLYMPRPIKECEIIKDLSGDKPVTLIYKATIDSGSLEKEIPLEPKIESRELYRRIKNVLPQLLVGVSKVTDSGNGASYELESDGASRDEVLLELQKIGSIVVTIKADKDTIDAVRVVIPESDTYKLPIPKAALFGKRSFALTLSDVGAVTNISYGKTAGTAGTLNALSIVATAETAATKAANLKAQADLIAQQQRLVRCLTQPDECK